MKGGEVNGGERRCRNSASSTNEKLRKQRTQHRGNAARGRDGNSCCGCALALRRREERSSEKTQERRKSCLRTRTLGEDDLVGDDRERPGDVAKRRLQRPNNPLLI